MITYTVRSMEELAKAFEEFAARAKASMNRTDKKNEAKLLLREHSTWSTAADIVRKTKIAGQIDEKSIQDALGTAESGKALIEVARNAHRAEQQIAELERLLEKVMEK